MADLKKFGIYKGEGNYHEEILYSMAFLYNIISMDIARFLKKNDLSIGKLNILIAIKHHGGTDGLRQVKIGEHLILTPSNMTKMIDKLEKEELVARFALEGDRRVNMIQLTKRGNKLLDEVWDGYIDKLKNAVKDLKKDGVSL